MTVRQNPIPGLFMPAIRDAKRIADNLQALLLWSKTVSPRLLFVDGPLVGANPPKAPSDAYLEGGGTQVVTFAAGAAPVTFPKAFPNGVMWIVPWHPSTGTDVFSISSPSLSGFTLQSSAGGSGAATIGYTVLGW